jgi:hypothetical protein
MRALRLLQAERATAAGRTTVPRRAIDAAARDVVYLNIELIGGARVREVARYEPSLEQAACIDDHHAN